MVKAPSNYSPTADVEAARDRRHVVLETMRREWLRFARPAAQVDFAAVKLQPTTKANSVRYFTDWALPQLDYAARRKQRTDRGVDHARSWNAVDRRRKRSPPTRRTGLRARSSRSIATALIRAMVGGRDYVQFDLQSRDRGRAPAGLGVEVVRLPRRARSRAKPDDTVVDEPVTIDGWTPRNSTRTNRGPVSLANAFALSINTVARRSVTSSDSAPSPTWRAGSASPADLDLSVDGAGNADVRLIDMTRAFARSATRGSPQPYGITKVVTAAGRCSTRRNRKRAGSSLPHGCRGNDRLASVRRSRPAPGARHRSVAPLPVRPAPPARTRTAGSSASQAV